MYVQHAQGEEGGERRNVELGKGRMQVALGRVLEDVAARVVATAVDSEWLGSVLPGYLTLDLVGRTPVQARSKFSYTICSTPPVPTARS